LLGFGDPTVVVAMITSPGVTSSAVVILALRALRMRGTRIGLETASLALDF